MDSVKAIANRRLESAGLTREDLISYPITIEVAKFHYSLSLESVLLSPIFQADIFEMTEAAIRSRIKFYHKFL